MSHIAQIETQIRDPEAVIAGCRRLNLPAPVWETIQLYSGTATGLAVQLPGWRYPAVCDTATGRVQYDNFEGHWGAQRELERFLQAYVVEKTRLEAHKQGHAVFEQPLTDGSIRLTIEVGAA